MGLDENLHLRKGRNMFRMSFDRNVLENVEEDFFVCTHAYVDIVLRTQLLLMHTHT